MKYKVVAGLSMLVMAVVLCFAVAVTQAKTSGEDAVVSANGGEIEENRETDDLYGETVAEGIDGDGSYAREDKWKHSGGIQEVFDSVGTGVPVVDNQAAAVAAFLSDDAAAVPAVLGDEPDPDEEQGENDPQENEYADLAIANVNHYVNVRQGPDTDSEIVGKIYDGAVAQILSTAGEEDDWFQVVSGNVEGYIKAEFFLYGDAAVAVIEDYVTRYATVKADRLNVRKEPDISASRLGFIDFGEKVKILENLGEWLKVQYTERDTGYVAAEYVTVSEEFVYAKTLEEEAKEIAERRALEERQRISEAEASENTAITVAPPVTTYTTNAELRQQIVDYAMQYLGNKYVHGGQSLSGGTDCSGFTSLIYAEFGYSLSRTPEGQLSSAGRSIDYSEIQPGDVICYGSSGKCTHVALYIGDGQIIHAANSRKGVIISSATYDTILGVKNIID